jgi:hypothetical protein
LEETMQDRRRSVRDNVLYGGVTGAGDSSGTMDCVARNFGERGACVEFASVGRLPNELDLIIARKRRSFLARIIRRKANRLGLAVRTMITDPTESDLDARLRRSEQKKRQLQRRINELLGEG